MLSCIVDLILGPEFKDSVEKWWDMMYLNERSRAAILGGIKTRLYLMEYT